MKATYNFPSHVKGDTFRKRKITITKIINGVTTKEDLTDCIIILQFKSTPTSPVKYEFTTIDESILITDPLEGEFELQDKILDVSPLTYVYDCQIKFPDTRVKTYFGGKHTIVDDVSR